MASSCVRPASATRVKVPDFPGIHKHPRHPQIVMIRVARIRDGEHAARHENAGDARGLPAACLRACRGGLRTTYEPVTPLVRAGQRVRAGDPIGQLVAGHPGCPVAACLHWGLRRGTTYLDPLALLGYARVRLLPLSA